MLHPLSGPGNGAGAASAMRPRRRALSAEINRLTLGPRRYIMGAIPSTTFSAARGDYAADADRLPMKPKASVGYPLA